METNKSNGPTVVSVINLKGGVGKTTVVALLARHAFNHYRMNVLAIDLDPQANLSQALMREVKYKQFMDEREPSIVELFNGFAPSSSETPGPTELKTEDVIKSVLVSRYPEGGSLEILPSRFDFSDNLVNSIQRVDERILAKFISREMRQKDLILIDCAPTESILTRTAYHASRYIFIPVRTEFFSTVGFPLLKKSLDDFRSMNHGHTLEVKGVIINRNRTSGASPGPHHEESMQEIETLAEEYAWPVLEKCMYHSDGYPKLMKDSYVSYRENASYEFPLVADEILQSLGFSKPQRTKT
ncbi:MAG: ParA family protein [Gammaproteobacteria bacterium]|nr:ParA family protein [Gammaproteobacteria bacterium]